MPEGKLNNDVWRCLRTVKILIFVCGYNELFPKGLIDDLGQNEKFSTCLYVEMDQQIMFGFIVERGKELFINVFSWVGTMVEFFSKVVNL